MSEHEVLDIAISVLNEVELWDSLDSTKEDNNRRIMILGYVDGVRTMTNEILKAMQTDDKDTNVLNKPQTERSE